MIKILSMMVSGVVIAAFAGVAAGADIPTGMDRMKKVDEQ